MAQPVKTTRHLRARNCRSILETIHSAGPISAARLAEQCGLRPSTISNILKDLRASGCIQYCGFGASTQHGGKRPLLIRLSPDFGLLGGIELGSGTVRAVLRDFSLAEVARRSEEWSEPDSDDTMVQAAEALVDELLAAADGRTVHAIGLGVDKGIDETIARVRVARLAELLGRRFGCPVLEEEPAGLAACGEWVIEEHRRTKDLVFIDVPEENGHPRDVGFGLILDGRLYHGRGDAGHLPLSRIARNGSGARVGDLLEVVTGLLDPSLIVLRGADDDAATEAGPKIKQARFGEYAVAEGGVAHAFDALLDRMS